MRRLHFYYNFYSPLLLLLLLLHNELTNTKWSRIKLISKRILLCWVWLAEWSHFLHHSLDVWEEFLQAAFLYCNAWLCLPELVGCVKGKKIWLWMALKGILLCKCRIYFWILIKWKDEKFKLRWKKERKG